jgi:hypothetical protein
VIRKTLLPALTAAETRIAQRNREIRRKLKTCLRRLDRIESLHDVDRTDEALALSPELVRELADLTCLVHDVPPEDSSGAPADAPDLSPRLPAGEVRESFDQMIQELRRAETATTEHDQLSAMKAYLAAALRTVRRVNAMFRDKRKGEWQTPLDVYRRKYAVRLLSATALIVVGGSEVYAAYWYSLPRISILEASFGLNCDGQTSPTSAAPHVVPRGNATQVAIAICGQGRGECSLSVSAARFGEPAPFCPKVFEISWLCAGDAVPYSAVLAAEATGKSMTLTCSGRPRIQILEATYGANCAGKQSPSGSTYSVARGNVTTWIKSNCLSTPASCSATVQSGNAPDPAPFCAKDFELLWSCTNDGKPRRLHIEAEALGKSVELSCR